jgi:MGT family glycosyltransferase
LRSKSDGLSRRAIFLYENRFVLTFQSMSVNRFLFVIFPGFSHLAMAMPVAHVLRRQGHTVAFASNNTLREIIEGEGFQFFEAGTPDMSQERLYEQTSGLEALYGLDMNNEHWERLFIPLAETMTEDLLWIVAEFRPDALFADATAYGMPIVAARTGVLWASYTAGLFLQDSRDLPPIGPGLPPPRNESERQMYQRWKSPSPQSRHSSALDKVNGWNAALNRIRAKHGLDLIKNPVSDTSQFLTVSFVDESFDYPRSDLPPYVHFVGPSLWSWSKGGELPEPLKKSPKTRPIIFITLGTVFGGFSQALDTCVEALKDIDAQVVLTIGRFSDPARHKHLPDNFIVERFIPSHLILPITDLVIYHGGFGTTMSALAQGIPLVCFPISSDSPELAQRVQEAGAGLRLDNPLAGENIKTALTPEKLRAATLEVLGNRSYRDNAERLRDCFRQHDGPAETARLLAELVATARPVLRQRDYWTRGGSNDG